MPDTFLLRNVPRACASSGQLARAGWSILSPEQRHEANSNAKLPSPSLQAEGSRLVKDLVASWCSRYNWTIRETGAFDGGYHYECLFSIPLDELPVPGTIVRACFALVAPPPGDNSEPRLRFSFEEGDLQHDLTLQHIGGKLQVAPGQQAGTVKSGFIEEYLDRYIAEKKIVSSGGSFLVTRYESTRLVQPEASEASIEDHEGDNDDEEELDLDTSRAPSLPAVAIVNTTSSKGSKDSIRTSSQRTSFEGPSKDVRDDEMALALKEALRQAGLLCDKVEPPSTLAELLSNVFDAADENEAGELPHYEVALLLGALLAGLGLQEWDIQLLLTSAQENADGLIECKPFIQAAPEIIEELRRRRLAFIARGLPGVEITAEAIKHCFGDEAHDTAGQLNQLFDQKSVDEPHNAKFMDPGDEAKAGTETRRNSLVKSRSKVNRDGSPASPTLSPGLSSANGECENFILGKLKRRACRECLLQLPSLMSPQEVNRIMQMLPEDEDGFVLITGLDERLEQLRSGSILNALVESDPVTLRKELVVTIRKAGLLERGKLKLWDLKRALLHADQICLSMMQIHLLLCLAQPHLLPNGDVDVAAWAGICSSVLPHMFDAQIFMETAERLQLEAAELQKQRENAEIAALASASVGAKGDGEQEQIKEVEVNQEDVEKILINLFQSGESRGPSLPAETMYTMLLNSESQVQACQLSAYELTGFIAEMSSDIGSGGQVIYVEYVKRVVPIIFQMRHNFLLGQYLQEDAFKKLGIRKPNLKELESIFPLFPHGWTPPKDDKSELDVPRSDNRESGGRRSGRAPTKNMRRPSKNAERRSVSKVSDGGDSDHEEMRVQGRARLQVGGMRQDRRLPSKMLAPKIIRDTPNGRGYHRRRVLLGLEDPDDKA